MPSGELPDPPRNAWALRRIGQLVREQVEATSQLNGTLTEAILKIERLSFPLGSPVPGFDQADLVATLLEMKPTFTVDGWYERARELVDTP